MDKPEELDFIHLLYVGVVTMLLLVLTVVFFVIVHQKRAYSLQVQLRQQELDYQLAMLQSVVASQENERERIAQDLHDEIGASLSAARLFISQIQYEATSPHLQEMSQQAGQIISETVQNVRHIVQNISPAMLEKFGFCRAVATLGSRLEATGLQVTMQVHETVEELDAAAQLALYRIVQEIFANATKHAQAQHLSLSLNPAGDWLELYITDDGCGFTQGSAKATKSSGMGLAGIQARAKLLGGYLDISSAPGSGTRITLFMPR